MGAAGGSMVVLGGASGQGWLGDTWVVAMKVVVVGWESHRIERKKQTNRAGRTVETGPSLSEKVFERLKWRIFGLN